MALGPQMTALLERYGLGSLTAWASSAIISDLSAEEFELQLYDRPEFKAAFPEIGGREALVKTGVTMMPLSPDDVLTLRASYRTMMRSYGLPPSFWDKPTDFYDLVVNDVSPDELNARLEAAVVRVREAPPGVRDVFGELFGAAGDDALFSIFVDVDRALPELENMIQMAEAGGTARRFGFSLTREQMGRLEQANVDLRQAQEGFSILDERRGLFDESLFEEEDFAVGEEGIEAAFGLEGGAAEKLERRGETRTAQTQGRSGGLMEERGPTGLGGAGRR